MTRTIFICSNKHTPIYERNLDLNYYLGEGMDMFLVDSEHTIQITELVLNVLIIARTSTFPDLFIFFPKG